MTTSFLVAEVLLSKQLGDFWSSTTTSSGSSTTIKDKALMAFPNDWIDSQSAMMWDMITSGDYDEQERKITSLDNSTGSTGTLTVLVHGGTIASSVTYRIHRLFSASDKRIALVDAAKSGFPWIFKRIRDETRVLGNWALGGNFEVWTSSSYPDYHRVSTITAAQNTDLLYVKSGLSSCKLTRAGTDGYLYTDEDRVYDFKSLYGKSVTFSKYVFPDADDQVRLAIYDGTDTTYSDYNTSTGAFEELTVTATIADDPSAIEFRTYIEEDGDVYVDDERIIGPTRNKVYIGDLGLAQNLPYKVSRERSDYSQAEPWFKMDGYDIVGDYLYIPSSLSDCRLRIEGIGYLDFIDSSGDVGTDWDDTIAIDSPQTEILVAEAAVYLWRTRVMPTWTSGDIKQAERALAYWELELRKRQVRFGMPTPPASIHYT